MKQELNGYDMSRNFFDWCYENPDKINPSHIALYFFIIEHCNRLGWKDKFGLPTQMAMDAIGIKNWRTYKKAFDDLVEFGFIEVVQKSKNQYSANVIAIVKNTKANTKAYTKALQKHIQKHSSSTYSSTAHIFKPINNIEPLNNINNKDIGDEISVPKKTWKNDFEIYKENVRNGYREIMNDEAWFKKQREFYPNVDILKSIEKSCVNFWITEGGWKNKKKAKTETINWKQTFANAIAQPQNKVYYDRNTNISTTGNTKSGNYSARNDAEERRRSVENLTDIARAILQEP